jgi:hypothetical protein
MIQAIFFPKNFGREKIRGRVGRITLHAPISNSCLGRCQSQASNWGSETLGDYVDAYVDCIIHLPY